MLEAKPIASLDGWPTATSAQRGVPGGVVASLLLVCMFAPYGLLDAGSGTLRPDHIAVPLVFATLLVFGRVSSPPAFAWSLFGLTALAGLSSLIYLDLVLERPMEAVKSADGLLRGPVVFTIAASMRATDVDIKKVVRLLPIISIALALLGLADRLLPPDSGFMEIYVRAYGGPSYSEGIYGQLQVNHKTLMLQSNRASAVFVTAPALGMSALVFLELAIVPALGYGKWQRISLAISGLVAGLASNSKSFVIGVGVIAILALAGVGRRARTAALAAALVVSVGAVSIYFGLSPESGGSVNPLVRAEGGDMGTYEFTGGRFGGDESPIVRTMLAVLSDSPVIGFGLGQRWDLYYADSGFNRVLLHGGAIGLILFGYGLWRQRLWFRNRSSPWAKVAEHLVTLMLVLMISGAVFVMPRVNDLFFSVMGLSVVIARRYQTEKGRAESSGAAGHPFSPTTQIL